MSIHKDMGTLRDIRRKMGERYTAVGDLGLSININSGNTFIQKCQI